ncbi:kynurenine formamidase isoform X5 [Larus michahellis]|uniref:kynurenine formamidase isoform X5 n=1 Tax=Larus michahellis TaxID=119627 RepID=UPI003D9B0B3C
MGVWRDMPVEALEQQYSPSRWSPRLDSEAVIQAHLEATAAGTQRARAGAQTSLHVPYGDGDREKLDIYFPAEPAGAFPALVYIHGGYWQCLSKDESGFAAPPLVSQGVAVVALGYDIAPKGHMDAMVLQVRRSLAFLVRRYSRIRGLYLCGHSAGAHLAAMVLATDWTEYGVVPDIKGRWPRGTAPCSASPQQRPCPARYLWLWPSTTPQSSAGSRRSMARPCVLPAGPSPCWISRAWITLTSSRSCRRRAMSSLSLQPAGRPQAPVITDSRLGWHSFAGVFLPVWSARSWQACRALSG